MNTELGTWMQSILHSVSQDILVPVMLILAGLIVYAIWCVGSLVVEVFMERRHYNENVPQFVNAVYDADYGKLEEVVEQSGMLKRHKQALLTVVRNMGLSQNDLYALAKREVGKIDEGYRRVTGRNDFGAKIGPMFGLMGTLIPLGPGIVAMGQGQTETLSNSLLIAFDTTVAGLVAAAVCLFVSRIRKAWYGKYLSAMEAAMTAILEKADVAREEGVELPHGYVQPAPERSRAKGKAAQSATSEPANVVAATSEPAGAAVVAGSGKVR